MTKSINQLKIEQETTKTNSRKTGKEKN